MCDLEGKVLVQQAYAYDVQGNRTEERRTIGDKKVVTKTRYDAWNREIRR